MTATGTPASTGVRTLLSVLLALVPSLALLAEPSLPAAVLALAVAALCGALHAGAPVVLAAGARLARPPYDGGPVLRGRATDPVASPLRPRAPGTA
jgi:hypothetical protein